MPRAASGTQRAMSAILSGPRRQAFTLTFAAGSRPQKLSFAQVFEGDLDAFVVELLIVAAKLIAAIGAAMEELGDHPDRGVGLAFEPGRAANVDRAIEVEIVDIVVELAH